jgi:hypothetical protein
MGMAKTSKYKMLVIIWTTRCAIPQPQNFEVPLPFVPQNRRFSPVQVDLQKPLARHLMIGRQDKTNL